MVAAIKINIFVTRIFNWTTSSATNMLHHLFDIKYLNPNRKLFEEKIHWAREPILVTIFTKFVKN